MNPLSIPPILSSILFLVLGGFVFSQNRKSNINFTFLLICITTFWWQYSWFFLFNTQDKELAEILVKMGHVGIILLPVTILHFVLAFLKKTDRFNRIVLYLSYSVAALFEISLFTSDYLIDGYYEYFWGFYPKANFLHPFFLVFTTLLLIRIVYMLLGSLKKEANGSPRRFQMEYILISIIFYAFASSDFVVNYGFEFYPIGFIPILLFLGTIAYAIARYHLMDIRIVLTELLVIVIAFVLFVQIFTATTTFEYIWKTVLFIAFVFLGYLLIKSVLREIKRRIELQRLYREVERLNKTKSEFISIASHQLRTPLTAIKGYISMVMEGSYGKLSENQTRPLENVYQSNERLIRLVNDLLSVSRIESGKIKIESEETSIGDLVSSITEELKPTTGRKGINLIFERSEVALPKISVDKLKLRQVIINLIDNAIRYTSKGEVRASVKKSDSRIVISVADTGEGMTKDEIGNLFESFSRGKAGNRFWTEGAGLGLYIAKKFTDMHNGKIWAESKGMDKGSTFHIELPIK